MLISLIAGSFIRFKENENYIVPVLDSFWFVSSKVIGKFLEKDFLLRGNVNTLLHKHEGYALFHIILQHQDEFPLKKSRSFNIETIALHKILKKNNIKNIYMYQICTTFVNISCQDMLSIFNNLPMYQTNNDGS